MVATLVTRRPARLLTALLLAIGLLFAAVGPALAQTEDEAFGVDAEAVERLVEAGLVKGRTSGDGEPDYALEDAITRAELVTVLVRALGGAVEAETYEGDAALPDTADHWSLGWVAVGAELSHEPLGYPDGTFKPDQQVTAAEAVAFTMKFLGIEPADGEWPGNYLSGLAAAGIVAKTDVAGLQFVANVAAPRGLVFTLLDMAFSTHEIEDGKTIYDVLAEVAADDSDNDSDTDSDNDSDNGDENGDENGDGDENAGGN